MMQVAGALLMAGGALLGLLAGVGVARLPSTLSRIHAAAKPASLGLALVALGAGVASSSLSLVAVGALIVVFQFLTAPISGHLLGQSVTEPVLGDAEQAKVAPESRNAVTLVVQTTLVWIALWRDLSPANLLGGVLVGTLMALAMGLRPSRVRVDFVSALRALTSYAGSLFVANVRMARQVLAPRVDDLVETIVVCDLETRAETVALFDANAISFSPGTLTLALSERAPYRMVVHALGQDALTVNREVAELERSGERMYR